MEKKLLRLEAKRLERDINEENIENNLISKYTHNPVPVRLKFGDTWYDDVDPLGDL